MRPRLAELADPDYARRKKLRPFVIGGSLPPLPLLFMSLSSTMLRSTDWPLAVSVLTTSRTTCLSKPIAATSSTTLSIGTPRELTPSPPPPWREEVLGGGGGPGGGGGGPGGGGGDA